MIYKFGVNDSVNLDRNQLRCLVSKTGKQGPQGLKGEPGEQGPDGISPDTGQVATELVTNKANELGQAVLKAKQSLQKSNNDKLLSAAKDGNIEDVEHLINEGADVNAADKNKNTSLHFAVEGGYKKVVEVLLDKGAAVSMKDKYGLTPLHLAATNNDKDIVVALLEKKS